MTEPLELEQQSIGLRHYLDVVRRRKWIVLGVMVACIGAAALISFLQEPTYQATTKLVVGQEGGLTDPRFGGGSFVQVLTATMRDLVESTVVLEQVIRNLNLDDTPEGLREDISSSINPETAVLTLTVRHPDNAQAVRIANEIASVFSDRVEEQFGRAAQAAEPGETPPRFTVTVFDPAYAENEPVSPRPVRNVGVAGMLGLALGLLGAFLRDHFDRRLRTRETVEAAFGVPVIGQIPFERRRRDSRAVFWNTFGQGAEAFRGLRANLQYLGVKRPLQTILVTSASAEQGKTTVTANLAIAIARSGASAVVLEADLRRPRLGAAFGMDGGPGLTSVLVGATRVEDALLEVTPPSENGGADVTGRIALVPSGPLPPNPSELLSSLQMRELLDELPHQFDYVLVDSPPLLPVADALEVARMVDGVVLVVRRDHSSTDEAREVRSLVQRLDIHLVGVVFTDVESLGTYYGEARTPEERKVRESEALVREEF